MEIVQIFPDEDNAKSVEFIKSNASFVFKNCPSKKFVSKTIEIPESKAEWWIEFSDWAFDGYEFHVRIISVHFKMDLEENPSSIGDQTFDGVVESTLNVSGLLNDSDWLKVKKEFTGNFIKERNGVYKAITHYIYCKEGNLPRTDSIICIHSTKNNNYDLKCRVTVSCEPKLLTKLSGNVGTSQVITNIGKLLDTSELSDFKCIVSGKEFKVHKLILSLASPYFATLFKSEFMESESNILVNNENPVIFQHLLEFIYKGKFPYNFPEIAMDVYKMAHLYQIDDLKTLSLNHVTSEKINRENALKVYQFSAEYEIQDLFELSWMFIRCKMLQLPKSKPFDRDPLTVEQIEKLVKINEDYEKKLEQCYQEIE